MFKKIIYLFILTCTFSLFATPSCEKSKLDGEFEWKSIVNMNLKSFLGDTLIRFCAGSKDGVVQRVGFLETQKIEKSYSLEELDGKWVGVLHHKELDESLKPFLFKGDLLYIKINGLYEDKILVDVAFIENPKRFSFGKRNYKIMNFEIDEKEMNETVSAYIEGRTFTTINLELSAKLSFDSIEFQDRGAIVERLEVSDLPNKKN